MASLRANPNASAALAVVSLLALAMAMIPARQRRQFMEFAREIWDEQVEAFRVLAGGVALARGSRRRLRVPSIFWRCATVLAMAALM